MPLQAFLELSYAVGTASGVMSQVKVPVCTPLSRTYNAKYGLAEILEQNVCKLACVQHHLSKKIESMIGNLSEMSFISPSLAYVPTFQEENICMVRRCG
jgi:hypothetical protein